MKRKFMVEYVWLDGYTTPNLRSKIKVIDWPEGSRHIELKDIPEWNFDGSSNTPSTRIRVRMYVKTRKAIRRH